MESAEMQMKSIIDPATQRVESVIKVANVQTEPKFSHIRTLDIQRRANGPWYGVEVNMIEMLQILQTGEYDEQPVTAVRIFEMQTENADMDVVYFIYDFVRLHTEQNPWRMM
jgi:hypothetical protein